MICIVSDNLTKYKSNKRTSEMTNNILISKQNLGLTRCYEIVQHLQLEVHKEPVDATER